MPISFQTSSVIFGHKIETDNGSILSYAKNWSVVHFCACHHSNLCSCI